jgi:hypothetical protein
MSWLSCHKAVARLCEDVQIYCWGQFQLQSVQNQWHPLSFSFGGWGAVCMSAHQHQLHEVSWHLGFVSVKCAGT